MNKFPQMDRKDVLSVKLTTKRAEHRDLDEAIHALHERGLVDTFTLQRLKRQKLFLKDEIRRLQDEITPDIIA